METAAADVIVDQAAGRKRNRSSSSSSSKLGESYGSGESKEEHDHHEVHIFTERERRKRMRNMFSGLHALLPHLPPKADKSTIVDEAVKYIKDLQETLETLENQKQQKHQRPISFSDSEIRSVITSPPPAAAAEAIDESREPFLGIDQDAFSNMPARKFGSCNLETWLSPNVVMNMCGNDAQISVCSVKKLGLLTTMLYILHKHKLDVVSAHVSSDPIRSIYMFHVHAGEGYGKYPEGFPVEDLFKLAAAEMNLWLLSCN